MPAYSRKGSRKNNRTLNGGQLEMFSEGMGAQGMGAQGMAPEGMGPGPSDAERLQRRQERRRRRMERRRQRMSRRQARQQPPPDSGMNQQPFNSGMYQPPPDAGMNQQPFNSGMNQQQMGGQMNLNNTSGQLPMEESLASGQNYMNIHKGQYGGVQELCDAFPTTLGPQGQQMGGQQPPMPPSMPPSMPAPMPAPMPPSMPAPMPPSMPAPMPTPMGPSTGYMGGKRRNMRGGVAPVGYTGVLDQALRESARINPIDNSIAEIQGMSDQAGGRRRRSTLGFFGKMLRSFSGGKARKTVRKSARKTQRKGSKSVRKTGRKGRKSCRTMRGGQQDVDAPSSLLPPELDAVAVSGQNPETGLARDPSFLAPKM